MGGGAGDEELKFIVRLSKNYGSTHLDCAECSATQQRSAGKRNDDDDNNNSNNK